MSTRGIIAGFTAASVALAGAVMVTTATASTAATPEPVGQSAGFSSAVSATPASTDARSVADKPIVRLRANTRGQVGVRAQVRAQRSYAAFTLRSSRTRDMRGIEGSLYRGRYYRASVEPLRKCIAERESEGHYDVVSRSGLYYGAYQVSRPLARGATWMMLREHKQLMGSDQAREVLARLRTTPMNKWPRYWQDAAFATVMNWEHTRSGVQHWAGGRWHC